jgi:hypothetical protein
MPFTYSDINHAISECCGFQSKCVQGSFLNLRFNFENLCQQKTNIRYSSTVQLKVKGCSHETLTTVLLLPTAFRYSDISKRFRSLRLPLYVRGRRTQHYSHVLILLQST